MAKRISSSPLPSSPAEPLSRKDVEHLISLIRANDIQEFEMEQGDLKLRIVASRPNSSAAAGLAASAMPPLSYAAMPYYPPGGMLMPPGAAAGSPLAVPAPAMPAAAAVAPTPPAASTAPAPAAAAPSAAPTAVPGAADESDLDNPKYKKILSPMVGTFYRAPAPNAKPFVNTGAHVEEETVLCIIEAMKLMNEIRAEMRGVVKRILVENAQPVEYNQPLFLIEPS